MINGVTEQRKSSKEVLLEVLIQSRGGTPNFRVHFHEDIVDEKEPEIVEPSNILDDPSLLYPMPTPPKQKRFKNQQAQS